MFAWLHVAEYMDQRKHRLDEMAFLRFCHLSTVVSRMICVFPLLRGDRSEEMPSLLGRLGPGKAFQPQVLVECLWILDISTVICCKTF